MCGTSWFGRRRQSAQSKALFDLISTIKLLNQWMSLNVSELLRDQVSIIGINAKCIFDVGSHTGATTAEYLDNFSAAKVFALEPEPANLDLVARVLGPYYSRVVLLEAALSESDGLATFHINSHNGTHSLLPIGDIRYWAAPESEVSRIQVKTRSLDSIATEYGIDQIDIVKMDIQGGELSALKGAQNLLRNERISLLTLEVEFKQLYQEQPMFWDLCSYLQSFGYSLYKLYEPFYHPRNQRVLCWGDAIFLSPSLVRL